MTQQYTGQIVSRENGFYKIEASDASPVLNPMFLRGWQIQTDLTIGTTGKLVYRSGATNGVWYLVS